MALVQHQISKLNSVNYANWSVDMKFLLLEKNAWDIVNGNEKLPEVSEASGVTNKDVKDFKARVRIALSTIYLNIEDEFRRVIENEEDPSEVWKILQKHHEPDNRSRHMMLFSEFMSCKIKPNEKVDIFASRLSRISHQQKAIGHPIEELYMSFQLLRYLPSQFDSIVQSILRWPDKNFVYKDIILELIAEESRLQLRNLDRKREIIENQHVKFQEKCWKCGRFGHRQRSCPTNSRSFREPRYRSPSIPRVSEVSKYSRPASNHQFSEQKTRNNPREYQRGGVKPKTETHRQKTGMSKNFIFLTQAYLSEDDPNERWVFDTAASHHFCKNKELFYEFTELSNEHMSVAVDGAVFPIEGTGKIKLKFGKNIFHFTDVMYSSKLRKNLLSGPKLDVKGVQFKGGSGKVKMSLNGRFLFAAHLKDGIYYLNPKVPSIPPQKKVNFETSSIQKANFEVWHRRFAHVCPELLENTIKNNGVRGIPNIKNDKFFCEVCKVSKQRRQSFKPINTTRSKQPLELLVMDVWGPIGDSGRNGERYFLSIIDEFSRKASVFPMREKSEVFNIFRNHVVRAERHLDKKVKHIRTDNGGEFKNDNFDSFCRSRGIRQEFTNPYSPEQNGICERFNQTVVNGVRALLNDSGLGREFWPEAALHFTYTWNRICHKNQFMTPLELYSGIKPSVRHLKPFGAIAYVGIPKQKRLKLDAKAVRGVMVGYAFTTKGYRIWLPEENSIIETINVSFKENFPSQHSGAVMGQIFDEFDETDRGSEEEVKREDSFPQFLIRPSYEPQDSSSSEDEEPKGSPTCDESVKSSRDVIKNIPLRDAVWERKAVLRPDQSRTDIYYFEQGKSARLRSLNDIRKYCQKHNIKYEPNIFSFKGSDKYQGTVTGQQGSSCPNSNLIQNSSVISDNAES